MTRPRWILHFQATVWRFLMEIGMILHRLAHPRPRKPAFWKTIPASVSPNQGNIALAFYVPRHYKRNLNGYRDVYDIEADPNERGYPVVVNFHGGGFTLGGPEDDARWATAVVSNAHAVVCSVHYRRAPEHPFPTAVEDGVDAVFYLIDHAEELGIDPLRIAVSGFSAGGNMSFTVPLRLEEELRQRKIRRSGLKSDMSPEASATQPKQVAIQHAQEPVTVTMTTTTKKDVGGSGRGAIIAICAFYPSCDYTATREERRKTNLRPDKELPRFFTNLFDMSYLAPPGGVDLENIYLSPGLASDDVLRTDLPGDVVLFTCEWDGLRAEAERFKGRLGSEGLGKRLLYRNIKGVTHAWDKSPNPLWTDRQAEEAYKEACAVLKVVFEHGKLQSIQE